MIPYKPTDNASWDARFFDLKVGGGVVLYVGGIFDQFEISFKTFWTHF